MINPGCGMIDIFNGIFHDDIKRYRILFFGTPYLLFYSAKKSTFRFWIPAVVGMTMNNEVSYRKEEIHPSCSFKKCQACCLSRSRF